MKAVKETAAPANAYFNAIGGAGSSADLRLQGKALIERAREQERQAKLRQRDERRAATKEKADGYRSSNTADLRAKLRVARLDASRPKAALVRRVLCAPPAAQRKRALPRPVLRRPANFIKRRRHGTEAAASCARKVSKLDQGSQREKRA